MQAVILAAGESSRFWPLNQKHKSLFKITGRPLIYYTIDGLRKSGIKDIIIVQGPKRDIEEELKNYELANLKIRYVVQLKPRSTGDAVWRVKKLIKGPFLVAGSHKVDLADYLELLLNKFKKNPEKIILLGTKTERTWDYGVLQFSGKKISKIVENPVKGKEPSDIKTSEAYIFPSKFFDYYERVPQREENLIDAINLFIKEKGVEVVLAKKEPVTLKYPWDLFPILEYLLKNNRTKIYIGKNCQISPNCHLRGPVSIGGDCRIGNSVEIKNSIIGDNTRIPHLSYIGDSIIGENCNIGAGMITANLRFDKKTIKSLVKGNSIDTMREKFGCVIGNDTQVGINCSIMPGVLIGSNCQIGPASLVRENIEDKTTFYSEHKGIRSSKR